MKLQDLTEEKLTAKKLLGSGYIYHAVFDEKNLDSIFKSGLRPGTNVSFDTKGQAFEDEGGTILVFNKSDYLTRQKSYQEDGMIASGNGKPVAILKDTSVEIKDAVNGDDISDDWEKLEKEFAELARVTDMTVDDLETVIVKRQVRKDRTIPEKMTETQYQKLFTLERERQRIWDLMDELDNEGNRQGVSHADVLKRYKKYGVPVFKLPKIEHE
jgi:hypothetical protein